MQTSQVICPNMESITVRVDEIVMFEIMKI